MTTEFLLPDGALAADAAKLLGKHLTIGEDRITATDETFYDTFDGRLHKAGLTLRHSAGKLALDTLTEPLARRPAKLMLEDLPAGRLREALADVIEMRALMPVARVKGRRLGLKVLDDERKTVVRLVSVEGSVGDKAMHPRLVVSAVRGYDKALARVQTLLADELGLLPADGSRAVEATGLAGGVPGGVSSKLSLDLRPYDRADRVAAKVLKRLTRVIEANLPGTLADIDSEFLHDLRVAVRRSRAVQRELRKVFPSERLEHFRAGFKQLQAITGPVRDLDVYLLDFDEFVAALPPERSGDLEPLRQLLTRQRVAERRKMDRALKAPATQQLLTDWVEFLDALPNLPVEGRPDAVRPIREIAQERIGTVYRRMVKDGNKIDDASPADDLHELRKKGKELRYLLEFFGGLFDPEVAKPMVSTLKALQDTLGRHQDREVQADTLRALGDQMTAQQDGAHALMAMGVLVERLTAMQQAARDEFAERFAPFASEQQRARVKEGLA